MGHALPHAMHDTTAVALRPKHLKPGMPLDEAIQGRAQRTLKVAILEDTPMVLELYLRELRGMPGIEIVNDQPIQDVDSALLVCQYMRPDVVIADLNLEKSRADGFGVIRYLRKEFPNMIVALSTSVWPANGRPMADTDLERRIRKECFDAVFNKGDLDGIKWALNDIASERFIHGDGMNLDGIRLSFDRIVSEGFSRGN